jgi:hypothetical protein
MFCGGAPIDSSASAKRVAEPGRETRSGAAESRRFMATSIVPLATSQTTSPLLFAGSAAQSYSIPNSASQGDSQSNIFAADASEADAVQLTLSQQAAALVNQGETVSEIATALDTDVATVDGYLDITPTPAPSAAPSGGGGHVPEAAPAPATHAAPAASTPPAQSSQPAQAAVPAAQAAAQPAAQSSPLTVLPR